MGAAPAAYVRRFDPRRDAPAFADIVHRWTRETGSVALLWLLRQMIDRAGSVEDSFSKATMPAPTTSPARSTASRRARWRSI